MEYRPLGRCGTVVSSLAVASHRLSWLKARAEIEPSWPAKTRGPEKRSAAFQSLTTWSALPVASQVPSGLKAMSLIAFLWPRKKIGSLVGSVLFRSITTASYLLGATSQRLTGLNVTCSTH